MTRRLVAALACRIAGTRLYGKPLQLLDVQQRISVLDHIVRLLKEEAVIDQIVLGVAHGAGNDAFVEVAARHGVEMIRGDETDVLSRLIQCGERGDATDIFRITTESPYPYWEAIADVWRNHVNHRNDVTVIDGLPEGSHFEIYTLESLRRSHEKGDSRHRSELCSLYVREHRSEFQVEIVPVSAEVSRDDLRLTIDYPEDLIVCRRVYEELRDLAPKIPLGRIIAFLDREPELHALVAKHVSRTRLFPEVA